MMALFGLQETPQVAARHALEAAQRVGQRLADLNAVMAAELASPLRVGIGLHIGPAIVGELGHGQAKGLTAIGDTVNTASRLEGLSKDLGAQMVVAQAVFDAAGVMPAPGASHQVEIRGRSQCLHVRAIQDVTAMPLS